MKYIKTLFVLSILGLISVSTLFAQPFEKPSTYEIPQQSIYAELGGNGLFYSLNYDVLFKNGYGIRLGGSYLFESAGQFVSRKRGPYSNVTQSTALIGLVIGHKMLGRSSSKIKLGAGVLFGTIYDSENWDFIKPPGATFSAGYRYYPADSGRFTFKAAFTPVISRDGFHPRFGVSFGITLTPEGNTR